MKRVFSRKSTTFFIIGFVVFFFIPLVVSISYGNIPFHKDFLGYQIKGTLPSSVPLLGIPTGNTTSPNSILPSTATSVDPSKYYLKKEKSFLHVQRDVGVLILVAILSILLDRKFGKWVKYGGRRR
ncbi:hypothetical protein [Paenibacillus typhae]|uniref:Uncharacterized protein n=1 Tax=Paenibacillus typhae TaxID=1174501 RepID=A0A1G8F990_9BACL|nr:hypothetical protein [Paenibacillus typhae]SDH78549.1 hypothetical protein SAMN05216192_101169 [Paenibacillus typhae]